jgi:CRP-like cAMP-binding protein
MYESLWLFIDSIIELNAKEKALVENCFVLRQVPKKHFLVKEGEVTREIYFIKKGILRLLYNKDGEDITAFIFQENLFASAFSSFLEQKPSIQELEALEDCDLLVMQRADLYKLYETIPKFNTFTRILAEQRFIHAQRVVSSHILKSPEQRYQDYAKENPGILQRVPQHIIASFLGITPVSLSRIRKRLLHK